MAVIYGSWIYNYLCNQCLSPLMLWVRIPPRARAVGCIMSCLVRRAVGDIIELSGSENCGLYNWAVWFRELWTI
jgi:hypothetical protein